MILHVGEYLAKYAVDFCKQYGNKPGGYYDDSFGTVEPESAFWTGKEFGKGNFHTCCTVGVAYMYYKALGVKITDLGAEMFCPNYLNMKTNSNWVAITKESDLKPGDMVYNSGHAEMIIEGGHHVNFGNTHPGVVEDDEVGFCGGEFLIGYRLAKSVQVDPSGKVTGTGEGMVGKKVDYSNFYFNGIPDGKYSLASRESIFEILINALKELINFFTGLIGYLFRGLIIGIISVFDRLINNTIESVNDSPKSLQESGVQATNADDPYSMNRSVTIEGLIFNDIDLFDINIFKVD